MDENNDIVNQLEFLLNGYNDPAYNNPSCTFNYESTNPTNITAINYQTNNMCSSNQEPYFSLEQALNIPGNVSTGNYHHIVMQQAPVLTPFNAVNHNLSLFPVQNPENYHIANAATSQEPNWEAINAFLHGQVRPGTERVFQCAVCGAEYVNAQALGGHMRCHGKNKKQKKTSLTATKTRKSQKTRHS